jgi:hypothetical protein
VPPGGGADAWQQSKSLRRGALHARTGKVVWVGGLRKDSELFIANLAALEQAYPKAKRLLVILDN